jgi:hypothetical protein
MLLLQDEVSASTAITSTNAATASPFVLQNSSPRARAVEDGTAVDERG